MQKIEEIRNNPSSYRVILGSASAARKKVFEQLMIPFEITVSDFAEDLRKEDFPDKSLYPLATSKEKTEHILGDLIMDERITILVTCDSVIIRDDNVILEKPESAEHAFAVLKSLSGKIHTVVTGVVVTLENKGRRDQLSFIDKTSVTFFNLTDETIRSYVRSGEPFGKAGSYAVQGLGALLVDRINGNFDNVVGIPLRKVATTIAELLDRNVPIHPSTS